MRFVASGVSRRTYAPCGISTVLLQAALPAADGGAQEPGHASVALEAGDGIGLVDEEAGTHRRQLGDRGEDDALLAERRQDLAHVAAEGRARADHEDALLLEQQALGVEQVGRPVQRDGRLAGAGPALDDQDPAERGADRPVLVGLDRGDDVAHAPGAAAPERLEQRGLADELQIVGGGAGLEVEQVVVQRDDLPAAAEEVPAAHDPEGHQWRRPVEGGGGRRPPVDDEGITRLVGHAHAAEVERLATSEVEASEAQGLVAHLELAGPRGERVDQPVPLEPVRERAGATLLQDPGAPGVDVRPQLAESGVGAVDVGLLEPELGLLRHRAAQRIGAADRQPEARWLVDLLARSEL